MIDKKFEWINLKRIVSLMISTVGLFFIGMSLKNILC